jgi:hypothetical protein
VQCLLLGFISGKTSITGQRKGSSASSGLPHQRENSSRRDVQRVIKEDSDSLLMKPRFISSDEEEQVAA